MVRVRRDTRPCQSGAGGTTPWCQNDEAWSGERTLDTGIYVLTWIGAMEESLMIILAR